MPAGRRGGILAVRGRVGLEMGEARLVVYLYVVTPGSFIVSRNRPCIPECLDRPEPLGSHRMLVFCIVP